MQSERVTVDTKNWRKRNLSYVAIRSILGKITVYREELAARGSHCNRVCLCWCSLQYSYVFNAASRSLDLLIWMPNDYAAISSFLGPYSGHCFIFRKCSVFCCWLLRKCSYIILEQWHLSTALIFIGWLELYLLNQTRVLAFL